MPDQRNGVTRSGDMPATHLVSRHCHPPHASYATKRPGTAGKIQSSNGTAALSWKYAVWLEGSRPCNIRFRLVTAVSLTTNWCTSEPHLIPKRSIQPVYLSLSLGQISALYDSCLEGLRERWFPTCRLGTPNAVEFKITRRRDHIGRGGSQ